MKTWQLQLYQSVTADNQSMVHFNHVSYFTKSQAGLYKIKTTSDL